MAQSLDAVQLASLYNQRLEQGANFTPLLTSPRDIVNYFIYVGNALSKAAEDAGDKNPTIIRYAMEYPYPIENDAQLKEVIRRHQSVFRSKLTHIRASFKKEGKQIKVFSSVVVSADRLEPNSRTIVYAWEFRLKNKLNATLAMLDDVLALDK